MICVFHFFHKGSSAEEDFFHKGSSAEEDANKPFFIACVDLCELISQAYPTYANGAGKAVAECLLSLLATEEIYINYARNRSDKRITVCFNGRNCTTDVWASYYRCQTVLMIVEIASIYYTENSDIDKLLQQLIGFLAKMKVNSKIYGLVIRSEQMKLLCLHRLSEDNVDLYDYEEVTFVEDDEVINQKQDQLFTKIVNALQCHDHASVS